MHSRLQFPEHQYRSPPTKHIIVFSSNQEKSYVPGTEDDLEYYVRECGDILGVSSKLPSSVRDAKHILDYIFHQIVEFKKLNQVTATLNILT